jgi:hypothetical protein
MREKGKNMSTKSTEKGVSAKAAREYARRHSGPAHYESRGATVPKYDAIRGCMKCVLVDSFARYVARKKSGDYII